VELSWQSPSKNLLPGYQVRLGNARVSRRKPIPLELQGVGSATMVRPLRLR